MKAALLLLASSALVSCVLCVDKPSVISVEVSADPPIVVSVPPTGKITERQSRYGPASQSSSSWQDEDWPDSGSSSGSSMSSSNSNQISSSSGAPLYMMSGGSQSSQSSNYQQQPQQQSSNRYGGQSSNSGSNNLAIPLPAQSSMLSLSQLYLPANAQPFTLQYPGPVKVANPRQELLANINFLRDFDSINPRNPSSLWSWVGTGSGTGYLADRASFVKRPADYKYRGHLDLISIPFSQYVDPNNASEAELSYYEGAIQLNNNITLTNMQRLMVRLVSGCETLDADQFPLPVTLSKNPWDDPR